VAKKKRKDKLSYKPLIKVKAAMVESGVNQEELAQLLNISTATLNRKLNGIAEFKLTELKKIAGFLNIQESRYFECFFTT